MSLARSETQVMLADMAGRLLADANEFEARRHRLSRPAPDRLALWPLLAEQGLLGASFGEDAGGFGGAMRDLAVVMELVGQRLVVEPVLATAICGLMLHAAGDEDMVASIIAGTRTFAFAHMEGMDPFAPPATAARVTTDGYRLTGSKLAVRHGDIADALIVTAMIGDVPACFMLEGHAAGLTRSGFRLIDSSSATTIILDDVPGRLVGGAGAIGDALLWSCTGLAAEVVGIVAALNAATFAYLGTRRQFGMPLAGFQALQHRAADMFAAAEEARALADAAIDSIDAGAAGRFALASAAKALADDAGRRIGHEAVQMHGGMGVSDELDVSHYMRRLAAIRAELGGTDMHRARFAALMTEG